MNNYKHLIIGVGMTADAAARISKDVYPPKPPTRKLEH